MAFSGLPWFKFGNCVIENQELGQRYQERQNAAEGGSNHGARVPTKIKLTLAFHQVYVRHRYQL